MANYVGADWASKGWVSAELDEDGGLSVGFHPTIWNLWHDLGDDAEQLLVDIPVGLEEGERRTCDEQAAEHLENRRSSVFWTPIRDAVYEDNIVDAKAVQTDTMEHSISNQSWAIVPRIREVDTFLRKVDDARNVVRESHPEVCFRKLDGGRLAGKSTPEGLDERRETLDRFVSDDWRDRIRVLTEPAYARQSAEDDVLDAIALAVTAKYVADDDCSTFPDDPPADAEGLPMEIVYPEL